MNDIFDIAGQAFACIHAGAFENRESFHEGFDAGREFRERERLYDLFQRWTRSSRRAPWFVVRLGDGGGVEVM